VIAVVFQIAFRAEIHVNDFFYFLKIIFNISTSKRSKRYKPHSILTKKKIQNLTKHTAKQAPRNMASQENTGLSLSRFPPLQLISSVK
jgi:hypothetical protein